MQSKIKPATTKQQKSLNIEDDDDLVDLKYNVEMAETTS